MDGGDEGGMRRHGNEEMRRYGVEEMDAGDEEMSRCGVEEMDGGDEDDVRSVGSTPMVMSEPSLRAHLSLPPYRSLLACSLEPFPPSLRCTHG